MTILLQTIDIWKHERETLEEEPPSKWNTPRKKIKRQEKKRSKIPSESSEERTSR